MQTTTTPVKKPQITPEKKPHKKLKITLIIIISVILALVIVAVVIYNHKLNLINYDNDKNTTVKVKDPGDTYDDINGRASKNGEYKGDITVSDGNVITNKNVKNILLLGTDERSSEFNVDARADSICLMSINTKDMTIKLVSFERGTAVPIANTGEDDWLTHTFRYGGANLTVKTIEDCFKLKIDNYVRVNFYAFKPIVDTIGGVDITLTEAEAKYLGLKTGVNHLDGTQALAYSRLRKIDSDWYRVQRQRNVIKACMGKLNTLSTLELNSMIDKFLPLVITDMTKSEVSSMTSTAMKFLGSDSIDKTPGITIPTAGTYGNKIGMGGRSMFACDFNKNKASIDEFLYGQTSK